MKGVARFWFLLFLFLPILFLPPQADVESTTILSLVQAGEEIPTASFSVNSFAVPEKGEKGSLSIHLAVPLNSHLYLDSGKDGLFIPISFDFSAFDSAGYDVTPLNKPAGNYDKNLRVNILRGGGDFTFSIAERKGSKGKIPQTLKVKYQTCDDLTKICYPPLFGEINLTPQYSDSSGAGKVPPVNRLGNRINNLYERYSKNFLYSFLLMVAAGIFSAATPCVYPMIPITSAILLKRDKGHERIHIHTVAYFLGIVLSYAILGYIAGMTGGAFSFLMRTTMANLFLAILFFIFAFSMFDIFEFSWVEKLGQTPLAKILQHKGGLTGTLLMGMGAGIIISPCVAPVVFTLLLRVADRIAEANAIVAGFGGTISSWQSFYIAGYGAVLMAGFGLGIGLPFLIVGFFSHHLPKAGGWLVYVKHILGLFILYIAGVYYLKWMNLAGVKHRAGYLILLVIVVFSLLLRFGITYRKKCRPRSYLAFIILAIGMMVVYGGYRRRGTAIYVPIVGADQTFIEEGEGGLAWYRDFEAAKGVALREKKPLFVDFYADWCANCLEFGKLAANDAKLNAALKKVVLVKIYDTDPAFETFKKNPDHAELQVGLPYFALFRYDGKLYWEGTQYDAVDAFDKAIGEALEL